MFCIQWLYHNKYEIRSLAYNQLIFPYKPAALTWTKKFCCNSILLNFKLPREKERVRERDREKECVCMCVCEWERECVCLCECKREIEENWKMSKHKKFILLRFRYVYISQQEYFCVFFKKLLQEIMGKKQHIRFMVKKNWNSLLPLSLSLSLSLSHTRKHSHTLPTGDKSQHFFKNWSGIIEKEEDGEEKNIFFQKFLF